MAFLSAAFFASKAVEDRKQPSLSAEADESPKFEFVLDSDVTYSDNVTYNPSGNATVFVSETNEKTEYDNKYAQAVPSAAPWSPPPARGMDSGTVAGIVILVVLTILLLVICCKCRRLIDACFTRTEDHLIEMVRKPNASDELEEYFRYSHAPEAIVVQDNSPIRNRLNNTA